MMPVGALLAGVLATALGVRAALWILTALIAASGLAFLLTPMRHLRDLPRRPAETANSRQTTTEFAARCAAGGAYKAEPAAGTGQRRRMHRLDLVRLNSALSHDGHTQLCCPVPMQLVARVGLPHVQ
jgi:hypothetical protein